MSRRMLFEQPLPKLVHPLLHLLRDIGEISDHLEFLLMGKLPLITRG